MNTFEEDMSILESLEASVKLANTNLRNHKESMVRHCPIKLGDEVVCNGHTHEGKTFVVSKVWLHVLYGKEYEFRARGQIKKKDGTLGNRTGEWFAGRGK